MPLTLRDHLKRDGWLPLTSFHAHRAIAERLDVIRNNPTTPLEPSVEALKKLIEDDTDLYMGFTQMFKEAGRASLVSRDDVPLHNYDVDGFLGPRLRTNDRFDQ